MRIEKAVCPHCGGPIEVRSHKVIKCEYCGMPIVISDLDLDDADNNGFEDTVTVDETITYEDFPIDIVKAAKKTQLLDPGRVQNKKELENDMCKYFLCLAYGIKCHGVTYHSFFCFS